jgi:hypothetical protein
MIGEPSLHRQAVHTGDHQLRLAAFEHLAHQNQVYSFPFAQGGRKPRKTNGGTFGGYRKA